MSFTAYSVIHIAAAALCAVLCTFHFSLWVIDRRDAANAPLTAAYFGMSLFALSNAMWSVGAGHPRQSPFFFWMAWIALTLIPPLLVTCWRAFERPIAGVRRGYLVLVTALVALRMIALALVPWQLGYPDSWEASMMAWRATDVPIRLASMTIGPVIALEAILAIRRGVGVFAWWTLTAAAIGGAMVTLGFARVLMGDTSANYTALVALPYCVFTSAHVINQLISARRSVEALGDASRYHVISKLGAGGMGQVFLASRTGPAGFERVVVLKRILGVENPQRVERFLNEARLAAQLHHPNIVSVHDLGVLKGGWFLVMEYLPGKSFFEIRDDSRRRGEPLPPALVARAGLMMARGLAYAHARGIVHRDISPGNIMLTFDGEVKIVDFGIAKEAGEREDVSTDGDTSSGVLTLAGQVPGKLPYISPERLAQHESTPSSDLYAVGVTLYELLAWHRPFDPKGALAEKRDPWEGGMPPLAWIRGDVPPAFSSALERLLARSPQRRTAGAAALELEMGRVLDELPPFDAAAWMQTHYAEDALAADSPETTAPSPETRTVESSRTQEAPPRPAPSRR